MDFLDTPINRQIERVGTGEPHKIYDVLDFPNPPKNGVIFLDAYTDYTIIGQPTPSGKRRLDLRGYRLECLGIVSIFGITSETSYLTSTGLTSGALITTAYSLPMQNLTIEDVDGGAQVFAIDGGGTAAIDWQAFNITNCKIGTIANVTNFIVGKSFWGSSYGLTFDGSIGTISFDFSSFTVLAGQTFITLPATLTINSRFRVVFSRLLSNSGSTAINVVAGVSIPTDMFILTDVSFIGAGAYITGITANDNRSAWNGCRGIDNSANSGYYYMDNNNTQTIIGAPNAFVKIAGTTTAGLLQRFTHTNNRLTYTGALSRVFRAQVACSAEAGSNNTLQVRLQRFNSLNVLQEVSASTRSTTSGNNRAENINTFMPTVMQPNDYLEVWIANGTNTNVTATEIVVMISL